MVVELRREERIVAMRSASHDFSLDESDIYSIVFDPAPYSGFSMVFTAQNGADGVRVISKPLENYGPLTGKPNGLMCTLKLRFVLYHHFTPG